MLILLVVLWLLGVLARDDSRKDTKYVIKHIDSCPEVGYYFRREAGPNTLESVCYLCFCQNDGTAVCWQRENKKCDAAHYQHGVGKRDTRLRRSPEPLGFSDIFFRDAARDLFNTQIPETCKPYETSFSEGCPPADWCVGCTVCDCDANGHWDCHILSFCPDKKDKNKLKTKKRHLRDAVPKRTTVKVPKRTSKTVPPKRTPVPKKIQVNTADQTRKNVKNVSPVKQPNKNMKQVKNARSKSNKNAQKRSYISPKPLFIKKDGKSKKPKVVKHSKSNSTKTNPKKNENINETALITQEIYKKVVAAMQTFLDKRISAIQPILKNSQKRSMVKRSAKNIQNTKNAKKKVNGHFKPNANKNIYSPNKSMPKNIKSVKKPGNVNMKGGTDKKPTKPIRNNGKRNKRDVIDYNITKTVIIENRSYINTEVPVTILPNLTLIENGTKIKSSTTNDYYKYTMITPSSSLITDKPEKLQIVYALAKNGTNNHNNLTHTPKKRDKENSFDEMQAIVVNSSAGEVKHDNISRKQKIPVIKDIVDCNDLKFTDWPQIKLLKKYLLIKKLDNVNSTKSAKNASNLTKQIIESLHKKHISAKDMARVVRPSYRKNNRSKIINTIYFNTNNSTRRYQINFRELIYNKINGLQNALKRVLVDGHKNNTKKMKPKPRRFNVIKYFKRFFSKMFRRYKLSGKNYTDDQTDYDSRIIDSICECLSNCDMTQKKNLVLRYKISQLNKESHTIIKTIKIIKGLLHLLDPPANTELIDGQNIKLNSAKSKLNDDIRKLNAVLKDKYTNKNSPLTSTQMTQIRYIKNNTQLFVKSVGNFANILYEIITILTKKQNIDEMSKHAFKTVERSYENNIKLRNDNSKVLKRLKSLIVKYNLIQNQFVRNMYKLLSKFEKVHENDTNAKVSKYEKKVTTATTEQFSRNIINNLRSLKSLANVLNSRRHKRDTLRDDDAMEYLLTMMEYMLKQNYPLDTSPVNDGIDLLLEAIKSAPDIKPIKKKVLQAIPVNIRISRTTEPVPDSILGADNSYYSRRINDDITVNGTRSENTKSENTKSETGEQNSNQENEKYETFQYYPGINIFDSAAKVNTEVDNDKRKTFVSSNPIDTTVIPVNVGIFGNVEETTEHNNFKKFEFDANKIKKFEVINSDLDDEDLEIVNTTMTPDLEKEVENTVTVTVPMETTEFKLANGKNEQSNINSAELSGNSAGVKRISLDWLDEGYEDSKEVGQIKNTTTTPTKTPVVITTVHTENVSDITREIIDEEKRRKSKINIEDVMYKKQMDLLNSLDYGTERSETDDVESKEVDERYSGDTFPSYFA